MCVGCVIYILYFKKRDTEHWNLLLKLLDLNTTDSLEYYIFSRYECPYIIDG